mmetsp:Transcript_8519/g.30724  ORF Transcript_8519/g.30724 Transcript_8519/m.30724 type:complete len:208 (+) Transcript_8519:570-1193(+)
MKGGIASRTSGLPHKKPIPVGAHILWPEHTAKSTPRSGKLVGMWGTDWHASSRILQSGWAPCLAAATISSTGLTLPRTLLTCPNDTSLVLGVMRFRRPSKSRDCVLGSSPANLTSNLFRWLSICHGTMLLWCSATVSTTSSPSPRLSRPQVYATKLMASLAFLVNTTSRLEPAPTKAATLSLACSYRSVALALSACTPRCTFELYSS